MVEVIKVTAPLAIAMTGCLSAVIIANIATSGSLKGCESGELITLAGALGTGGLSGAAGAMAAPTISLPHKSQQKEE